MIIVEKTKQNEVTEFPKLMIDKNDSIVLALKKLQEGRYQVLFVSGFGHLNMEISDTFDIFNEYNPFTEYNDYLLLKNKQ